jgi:hypothetical protein
MGLSDNSAERVAVPPPPTPAPESAGYRSSEGYERRNKVPWAWIIFGVVLSIATIAWFSHMVVGGYRQASALVEGLHTQMSKEDWDGIYGAASADYRDGRTEEENRTLFEAIARKLGKPISTRRLNISVNSNTSGTTVRASFETTFSKNAKATEHFTWTSIGGPYRLAAYEITSMDLITR